MPNFIGNGSFSGIKVQLTDTTFQNVSNLKYGSYLITVSPINIEGAQVQRLQ
jgi:hypothetical protein